jgi:hypothetical protein
MSVPTSGATIPIGVVPANSGKSKKAEKEINSISNALYNLGTKIRSAAINTIVLDRLASVLSNVATSLLNIVNVTDVAKKGKEIGAMAAQWGVATDKFQAFMKVAEAFGTERNDFADALGTLNEYTEEFIRGAGHVEDFKLGGFVPADFKDLDIIEKYLVFAEKTSKLAPNVKNEIFAKDLGDDLMKRLGAGLSLGGTEIARQMNEVLKNRNMFLKEELTLLARVNKAYFNAGDAFTFLKDRASLGLGIVVGRYLPALSKFVLEFSMLVEARLFVMLDKLAMYIISLSGTANPNSINDISEAFEGLGNTLFRIIRGIALAAVGFGALLLIFNPMVVVFAALFAASVLLADSLATWAEGGNSFLAPLLESPMAQDILFHLKEIFLEIWDILREATSLVWDILTSDAMLIALDGYLFILKKIMYVVKLISFMAIGLVRAIMMISNTLSTLIFNDFQELMGRPTINYRTSGGRWTYGQPDSTGTEQVVYNTTINTNQKEIEIRRPPSAQAAIMSP